MPMNFALAGGVQTSATATISSGVAIISDRETGSAQAIGVEFASFQVLGLSKEALNCTDADICLSKLAVDSEPTHISFEFE